MNSVLGYLLTRLQMRPWMDRPPVLHWRGMRPSRAPKSRPRSNASPVPDGATTPVVIGGLMPDAGRHAAMPTTPGGGFLKVFDERPWFDLATKSNSTVSVETDDVEDPQDR
jgi:hypothetical protein